MHNLSELLWVYRWNHSRRGCTE